MDEYSVKIGSDQYEVTATVTGGYRAATRDEPAEYPEVEIHEVWIAEDGDYRRVVGDELDEVEAELREAIMEAEHGW